MRNFISLFSISIFLLVLWRCNPLFEKNDEQTVPVSTVKLDLNNEKERIAEDLRELSDDLGRRIATIDQHIMSADNTMKSSLDLLRAKLVKEKKKVDRSLKDVEVCTADAWTNVDKKANQILTEAKIETQKIEERVEDILNN